MFKFIEQTKEGKWMGFMSDGIVKCPERESHSLMDLERMLELDKLKYECDKNFSAAVILDSEGKAVYSNLPSLDMVKWVDELTLNPYSDKPQYCKGQYANKPATYEIQVSRFNHYFLCQVNAVFVEGVGSRVS